MTDVIEQNFFAADKPLTERVNALKSEIRKMEQIELPTEHLFHGGMYCRQVWRPAGCTIVGKVHKKEHFYMVVMGTVLITTEDGVQELTAPAMLCSKPGTQRAVFAVTDAMCMTIHRADSATVEDVEEELVEADPESAFSIGNKLKTPQIEVEI